MAKLEVYDDLNTNLIWFAGGLSVLIFIVLVLGVQGLYYAYNSLEYDQKVLNAPTTEATQVIQAQREKLDRFGWADEKRTKAIIPIDLAIQLQARDLAKDS